MTKQIGLTQGKFALVDDEDFDRVNCLTWHAHLDHSGQYYARHGDKTIQMHRFILGVIDRKTLIDHINGDTLDNRKCNLRIATGSQNQANAKTRSSTGLKGIHRLRDKWRAKIVFHRKHRYLGVFDTPEEAARAYNQEAKKLFGEFSRLNKV